MTVKSSLPTATVPVTPSQVKFFDSTVGKTVKTVIYLAVSGALAAVIAKIQGDPKLFGYYTPIINVVLVAFKNLFDPNTQNLPGAQ